MIDVSLMLNLVHCESREQWDAMLFHIAESLGFDRVLYGILPAKHVDFECASIHTNYPSAWRRKYDALKFYNIDPVVAHCFNSNLPIVWEPEACLSERQKELFVDARAYGLCSGVTLPAHGKNGEFGLLSLASDAPADAESRRFIMHSMPHLTLLRDYALGTSLRFIKPQQPPEKIPKLTKREIEVLEWVWNAKSSWEIAQILHCSEATVNFHLMNIRQKFNVNTRLQAVVKAVKLGIFSPS